MTLEIYETYAFYICACSPHRSLAPKLFLDHVKALGCWAWDATQRAKSRPAPWQVFYVKDPSFASAFGVVWAAKC